MEIIAAVGLVFMIALAGGMAGGSVVLWIRKR